ncbi:synaptic vesicle 2-related protein [Trichonephila inaurata madagascariensis]|uniref:Synaptic vesicle 2-related protein n=1 Tax=Trichonephila inaurata madagascariensis TaxID=2747483 RepID=A0A8X6WNB5_9ARAC|nr:synaptic vesicle 2-related protein [Trichonephila inaurata madagascariensis]
MFWRRLKGHFKAEDNDAENETAKEQASDDVKSSETESNDSAKSAEKPPAKEQNKNKDGSTEKSNNKGSYYIDDVIDEGGYGWFQRIITIISGSIWFSSGCQIMILTFIGDYLACNWTFYRWQSAALLTVVFLSMSIGAPTFGYVGDNYGRKKALGLCLLIQFSFGAGAAAADSVLTMIILMAFVGFAVGGFGQAVTYACEFYPTKDRGTAGFYTAYYWNLGTIVIILIAWGMMATVSNWRGVMLIAALPSLIILFGFKWFPESPRYYLVSQQPEKALETLERMTRINKTHIPEGNLKPYEKHESKERGRFLNLFQPEHRRSILLMWYIWFSVVYTYYAYALVTPMIVKHGTIRVSKEIAETIGADNDTNAGRFPCKEFTHKNYVDLLWTTAAETPGLFILSFLVLYINRNTLLSGACFLTALMTFLLLIDTEHSAIPNTLLFMGRANIAAVFQMVFLMTMEYFPTTLRGLAVGSGSGIGRIGSVIAPFTTQVLLAKNPIVTICLIGLIILFAAVASACLPKEMKDKVLHEITHEVKVTKRDENEDSEKV